MAIKWEQVDWIEKITLPVSDGEINYKSREGFIKKLRKIDKNVLGVNYNGSVVENFYQPYECIFSEDVKRISFKEDERQNKNIAIYF